MLIESMLGLLGLFYKYSVSDSFQEDKVPEEMKTLVIDMHILNIFCT